MEFFGKPPQAIHEGPGWKTSLWSHVVESSPTTGRKTLFLASCVEGDVSFEGSQTVETFFRDKVENYPAGPPEDLVALHDWTHITNIDAMKSRTIFSSFIKQHKSMHRAIAIHLNLSGKFLGGSLIDAVLSGISFFFKNLIGKYDNPEDFARRVGELEKQYAGKKLTSFS